MKRFTTFLILGFIIMLLFTYISGLYDDAYARLYYTGVWYKDIIGSLKYYVLWVLPYWWIIIIIGALILALLIYGIRMGLASLGNKKA